MHPDPPTPQNPPPRPSRLSTILYSLIDGKNWLTSGEGTIWGPDVTPRVAVPEPR